MSNKEVQTNTNTQIASNDIAKNVNAAREKYNSPMVQALVDNASRVIGLNWHLKSFVAANPLKGFEGLSFWDASNKSKSMFGGNFFLKKQEYIDYYAKGEVSPEKLKRIITNEFKSEFADLEYSESDLEQVVSNLQSLLLDTNFKVLQVESDFVKFPYSKLNSLSHLTDKANHYLISFLSAYMDDSIASLQMPFKQNGMFVAFRNLVLNDPGLKFSSKLKLWIKNLSSTPEEALIDTLAALGLDGNNWEEYISASLAKLHGWSAFIKWRAQSKLEEHVGSNVDMVEYSLVTLLAELIFLYDHFDVGSKQITCFEDLEHRINSVLDFEESEFKSVLFYQQEQNAKFLNNFFAKFSSLSADSKKTILEHFAKKQLYILQQALEASKHEYISNELISSASELNAAKLQELDSKVTHQMAFCIDVRSEGIRRTIENVTNGAVETIGIGGFFGLPIKFKKFEDDHAKPVCPVIIEPGITVQEQLVNAQSGIRRLIDSVAKVINTSYKSLKGNFGSKFIFAEFSGLFYLLKMLLKSCSKAYLRTFNKIQGGYEKSKILKPNIEVENASTYGIELQDQVVFAKNALSMMNLKDRLAKYVIFTGHGSQTDNNLYASALDCGACGGQHGGGNAKVIASILNSNAVKAELAKDGFNIPEDTIFLAAEHNTTTDDIEIFDSILDNSIRCNPKFSKDLAKLREDLGIVANINCVDRNSDIQIEYLGDNAITSQAKSLRDRALDWSETRPEWGLAGNRACVIGPRKLSNGGNFQNQIFMHEYNWAKDEDGAILTRIMGGPMVVTQWINNQYYFSAVDNVNFGGGSKITQNLVGDFAVMQGGASDLYTGLSLQSVNVSDEERFHEPLRLRVYIYAPVDRVKSILDSNPSTKDLFVNQWIYLTVIDPEKNESFDFTDL